MSQAKELEKLFEDIENKEFEACKDCPLYKCDTVFAKSCTKHYADWSSNNHSIKIMSIYKDPEVSTKKDNPTNKMCFFEKLDGTAKNAKEFFANVILGVEPESIMKDKNSVLNFWYETNAIKHGIPGDLKNKRDGLCIKQCSKILKREIEIIKPKIIRVAGRDAFAALKHLGINIDGNISENLFPEPKSLEYKIGKLSIPIFLSLHPSSRSCSTASEIYKKHQEEINSEIDSMIKKHPQRDHVGKYFKKLKAGKTGHLYLWLKFREKLKKMNIL